MCFDNSVGDRSICFTSGDHFKVLFWEDNFLKDDFLGVLFKFKIALLFLNLFPFLFGCVKLCFELKICFSSFFLILNELFLFFIL